MRLPGLVRVVAHGVPGEVRGGCANAGAAGAALHALAPQKFTDLAQLRLAIALRAKHARAVEADYKRLVAAHVYAALGPAGEEAEAALLLRGRLGECAEAAMLLRTTLAALTRTVGVDDGAR